MLLIMLHYANIMLFIQKIIDASLRGLHHASTKRLYIPESGAVRHTGGRRQDCAFHSLLMIDLLSLMLPSFVSGSVEIEEAD